MWRSFQALRTPTRTAALLLTPRSGGSPAIVRADSTNVIPDAALRHCITQAMVNIPDTPMSPSPPAPPLRVTTIGPWSHSCA
ncbi:MAG: hypothetical protein FWF25_02090 [Propionibacteriaceae bacterium]|nr:hypothetical protein [Propionibacteriaceae bacterium]